VEVVYEKTITPFGNSAKVDAQKKYIGKRAYVIVLKD
jgi:putative transposon-encoded protein